MRTALATLILLAACKSPAPSVTITDATVQKYIQAYRNLRALGPDIAKQYQGPNLPDGQADYARIDKAVRDAGFSGYPEFVAVNGKIAWAFSTAQANVALEGTKREVSEAERTLENNIADPQVPEAAKIEMRKALQRIRAEYAHNEKWAGAAMTVADKVTDQETLAVVMRHRKEIEAAFVAR